MNKLPDEDNLELKIRILEELEDEPKTPRELEERLEVDAVDIKYSLLELEQQDVVEEKDGRKHVVEPPLPIWIFALRNEIGDLTIAQSVIRYLYEDRGHPQSDVGHISDYSTGSISNTIKA
ncbi:MAG: hypothetical protein ABEI86_06620, partial [Halobacteriaceae archaeon]